MRVQLRKPDGSLANPDIPDRESSEFLGMLEPRSRLIMLNQDRVPHPRRHGAAGETLLLRIAELVPKHPGRSKKAQAAAAAAQAKALGAGPSGGDAGNKPAGAGGKKKKGKK